MKTNEASWDRILRVVLGAVLLYLGLTGFVTGVWSTVFLALGVLFLVTGVIGFCPLYALLKVRTNKK